MGIEQLDYNNMNFETIDWPSSIAKPNFFIVGSPKCGTTSLANWLSMHSQVFFTSPKEPHFFNFDHKYRCTASTVEYAELFKEVTDQHLAIGEGSVWYLYSKCAVQKILEFQPEAKFIVLVRDPISFAISMHAQQRRSLFEDVEDLEKAWSLCEERGSGRRAPLALEPIHLDYASVCSQGRHIARLLKIVDRNRVFVGSLTEIQADATMFMSRVCKFLGIEWQYAIELRPKNKGYLIKSLRLAKIMSLTHRLKTGLGLNFETGALNWIWAKNSRPLNHKINDVLRQELESFFADDWAFVVQVLKDQKGLV